MIYAYIFSIFWKWPIFFRLEHGFQEMCILWIEDTIKSISQGKHCIIIQPFCRTFRLLSIYIIFSRRKMEFWLDRKPMIQLTNHCCGFFTETTAGRLDGIFFESSKNNGPNHSKNAIFLIFRASLCVVAPPWDDWNAKMTSFLDQTADSFNYDVQFSRLLPITF